MDERGGGGATSDVLIKIVGKHAHAPNVNRSATAEHGAAAARWACGEQPTCGLLGIRQREITASFPKSSRHWRRVKHAPTSLNTLGDHLRLARIDRGLKQREVAAILGIDHKTLEKWEHNRLSIGSKSQPRVLAFINNGRLETPQLTSTTGRVGNLLPHVTLSQRPKSH